MTTAGDLMLFFRVMGLAPWPEAPSPADRYRDKWKQQADAAMRAAVRAGDSVQDSAMRLHRRYHRALSVSELQDIGCEERRRGELDRLMGGLIAEGARHDKARAMTDASRRARERVAGSMRRAYAVSGLPIPDPTVQAETDPWGPRIPGQTRGIRPTLDWRNSGRATLPTKGRSEWLKGTADL